GRAAHARGAVARPPYPRAATTAMLASSARPREDPVARHLPWKALGAAAPAIGLLLGASPARAEVIEIGPEGDLIASVAALQPGDELVLRGGTYNLTSLF